MKLVKTGKFAFEGVRIKPVDSLDGLTASELLELAACGWVADGAESAREVCDQKATPAPDFDFAASLDKDDLDEYASSFGVKLDKRKAVEKMLASFRDAFGVE